jgi:hypothetical protein
MAHLEAAALPVLLEVLAGRCPWPAWADWQVGADGRLYAPGARDGFTPAMVVAAPWWRQLARHLQAKARKAQEDPHGPLAADAAAGIQRARAAV